MKRLLLHFLAKTGPFKSEGVEPWYTSTANVSKAYSLLFMLYMNYEKCREIETMTVKELWESDPLFKQYPFDSFQTYDKNMKALTEKRKAQLHVEEQCFRRDMQKLPKRSETSRGMLFWNTHPASKLLRKHIEMEMTGRIEKMKPQEIWATEEDYQVFDLNVLRKHIYQERRR